MFFENLSGEKYNSFLSLFYQWRVTTSDESEMHSEKKRHFPFVIPRWVQQQGPQGQTSMGFLISDLWFVFALVFVFVFVFVRNNIFLLLFRGECSNPSTGCKTDINVISHYSWFATSVFFFKFQKGIWNLGIVIFLWLSLSYSTLDAECRVFTRHMWRGISHLRFLTCDCNCRMLSVIWHLLQDVWLKICHFPSVMCNLLLKICYLWFPPCVIPKWLQCTVGCKPQPQGQTSM